MLSNFDVNNRLILRKHANSIDPFQTDPICVHTVCNRLPNYTADDKEAPLLVNLLITLVRYNPVLR